MMMQFPPYPPQWPPMYPMPPPPFTQIQVPPPPVTNMPYAPLPLPELHLGENIDIGGNRVLQVKEFKGQYYVGIRQCYEADGKWQMGRTGINLTLPQWQSILDNIGRINALVNSLNGI